HDSLLYAIAMIKVFHPSADFANFEPEWLMSHVGMTTVHHQPSANLIVLGDTIDFGKVHLNHCASRWLHIRNEGEQPLTIDTLFSSDDFTLIAGDSVI